MPIDKAILDRLRKNDVTLIKLNLERNNLDANDGKELGEVLKVNHTLTSLNLWSNNLGAEDARALSDALKVNRTLTLLDLGSNNLGAEGARALSDALKVNYTLTVLYLQHNNLGAEGEKAEIFIAQRLKQNKRWHPWISACEQGEAGFLKKSQGISLHALVEESGYTLLMVLVKVGNPAWVKSVLPHYEHIDTRCEAQDEYHGKTALEIARTFAEGVVSESKENGSSSNMMVSYQEIVRLLICYQKVVPLIKNHPHKVECFKEAFQSHHLNLSKTNITFEAVTHLVDTFKEDKTLTSVDLSQNTLNDEASKALIPLLQAPTGLRTLNLSDNRITYVGAKYLATGLKKNTSLTALNLQGNFITAGKELFEALSDSLKVCQGSLTSLDISQNFLDKACDESFKEEKDEMKLAGMEGPVTYRFSFFRTQPRKIRSVVEPTQAITPEQWMVCLTCKKEGTEHSMIYIEGMRDNGQRFLERYHITAQDLFIGLIGKAQVEIESLRPQFFNPAHYHFQKWPTDREQGESLQGFVLEEKGKKIDFSKFYPSSNKGTVNCLEWCIKMLALINIQVERSLFPFPSHTARGGTCLVM